MKAVGIHHHGVVKMDIDLEQEFQLLMRVVIKQINDKITTGELTEPEASQLIDMVNDRMFSGRSYDNAWSQSQDCYED